MNTRILFLSALLAAPLAAAPGFHAETGASYFLLRETRLERGSYALSVDEPEKLAPFVAGTWEVSDRFDLRVSYSYVNNAHTTATLRSPPGSPLTVIVYGHFDDDVHVVSAAPEFKWAATPQLTLAFAPQVNWVASRGVISYSTTDPLVLLIGPRKRNEEGFTLGGSARAAWSLTPRAALALGYQYLDLHPSFDRQAHVISAGVQWRF